MDHTVTMHEYTAFTEGFYVGYPKPISEMPKSERDRADAYFKEWCEDNGCTFAPEVLAMLEARSHSHISKTG